MGKHLKWLFLLIIIRVHFVYLFVADTNNLTKMQVHLPVEQKNDQLPSIFSAFTNDGSFATVECFLQTLSFQT